MNCPSIFLIVLFGFFVQSVLSKNCTKPEADKAKGLIKQKDTTQSDDSLCVSVDDFTFTCSDSCIGLYADLNEALPDCELDSQGFEIVNIKDLYGVYFRICSVRSEGGMMQSRKELDEDEQSVIISSSEALQSIRSSPEGSADTSIVSSAWGGSKSSSGSTFRSGRQEKGAHDYYSGSSTADFASASSINVHYGVYMNEAIFRGGVLILVYVIIPVLLLVSCGWFVCFHMTQPAKATEADSSSDPSIYDLWGDRELVEKKLKFTDIKDKKVLGSGAFGVVWLVTYNNTSYASKRLLQRVVDPEVFEKFIDEVKLVAKIEHALFEYMPNGDLRDYLMQSATRHWTNEKLLIAIDIAEALVYVQSFETPIVHRDLKSRNVLLSEEMVAKVSDFGSARLMSENNTMTTQAVGTARWLAPEVVAGEFYDHTCDSYSLGTILTELDTHELPLHNVTDGKGEKLQDLALMHHIACRKVKPIVSKDCPEPMRELVEKCLSYEPKDRPTAVQISFALRKMLNNGSVLET